MMIFHERMLVNKYHGLFNRVNYKKIYYTQRGVSLFKKLINFKKSLDSVRSVRSTFKSATILEVPKISYRNCF
jgi:hypothetical protein